MTTRIACFGEAMIELSMQGTNATVGVAGDTLNTAVYLKRCAPKLRVDYVTRLGTDGFSDRIFEFIDQQNIGTGNIQKDPNGTPGLYAIELDDSGERSFTYWRENAAVRHIFADFDFSALAEYDWLYLSGISIAILPQDVREGLLTYAQKASLKIIFDSNYRPRLWENQATAQRMTHAYMSAAAVALPSIDDEMSLYGESAEAVTQRCFSLPGTGALKRGPEGPLCLQTQTSGSYTPAPKVVDTTAAGDSFNGGYLAALLAGEDQADALQAGHNMAAKVVQHRGAIIPPDV